MLQAILAVGFLVAGLPVTSSQDSISSTGDEEAYQQAMEQALQCQSKYVNYSFDDTDPPYQGLFCPAEYDIILCWPPTKAGEKVYLRCPEVADLYQTSKAFRECTLNGTWSRAISPEDMYLSGKYCKCLHCEVITTINSIGCGFSAIACIVAFLIFLLSRRLWCRRNHIHWHLISSFIINYFVFFVGLIIRSSSDTTDIKWLERVLDTLYYYALMTNYFWMLVEGLYLHTLVVFALRVDASRITFLSYVFIGWILPAFFVSLWAIVSQVTGEFANSLSEHGSVQDYVCVIVPIGVALFINCIFLFNIMRCLCRKLREQMRNEEQQSWRGAKATMVLVVLLGVHYVVFLIIVPIVESQLPITVTLVLQYINTMLTSTQGVQVSVIYVFLNSEVKGSIRRTTLKIMRKQDCPCVRRSLATRQRNSSYSRWFTDESTCLSTLRSSPSRHANGGQINSDMAATLNGGIGSASDNLPVSQAVSTAPKHSPILEDCDEPEKYELGALPEDVDIDKREETHRVAPRQEGVPLLKHRKVESPPMKNGSSNGSPVTDQRAVKDENCIDDETHATSNETHHLTTNHVVC